MSGEAIEDIFIKLKAKWKYVGILHIIYKNPLMQRKTTDYKKYLNIQDTQIIENQINKVFSILANLAFSDLIDQNRSTVIAYI
ncbi:hypothetical protein HMPREF9211_0552 [Lactobacillus iners LactinV 01V1-a]|uniref:Uncharacterized protein n=1 Tax=Lactobacillus iners LactinV 01V1-a TaxID=879297 RepID=E1NR08_9LACO|nr:hypothetical protein HMPREF9211_0552 [Lactobacillus iners LactinV 01V1-a]